MRMGIYYRTAAPNATDDATDATDATIWLATYVRDPAMLGWMKILRPCRAGVWGMWLGLISALAMGCGGAQQASQPVEARAQAPAAGDLPYLPADDQDLGLLRDRYHALTYAVSAKPMPGPEAANGQAAGGDSAAAGPTAWRPSVDAWPRPADAADERQRLRTILASEYARRAEDALADPEHRYRAHERLLDIAALWSAAELRPGSDVLPLLAEHRSLALSIRASFARSGGDLETATALLFLATAEPASAEGYLSELDEIFAYADSLNVARFGPGAEKARPIEILETIAVHMPAPQVIDRLVTYYTERQALLLEHFRMQAPSTDLIRAHGAGAFRTVWNLLRMLARSQRLGEAAAAVAQVQGLGTDREVADLLTQTQRAGASAVAWIALAQEFDDERADRSDHAAGMWMCLAASETFSGQDRAALLYTGATMARKLGRRELAIAIYEHGFAIWPTRAAAAALADLYSDRIGVLAFGERPHAAQAQLASLEGFYAYAAAQWPDSGPLRPDLAQAYAMMGRGLASLGQIAQAEAYLRDSVARRPTVAALSFHGLLALKQDRFAEAEDHFRRALARAEERIARASRPDGPRPDSRSNSRPEDQPDNEQSATVGENAIETRLERARVLRLSGDALAGMGHMQRARDRWRLAIAAWMEIAEIAELPPRFQGELLVESAKAHWALGAQSLAVQAFEAAVDLDSDGDDTHTSVMSFFITRGDYGRALDTYHRALGSHEIGDYAKVYMSLWILAEAQRRGERADDLASEYLAQRNGPLWHDDLARFASGRAELTALETRAQTRGRRAEMWYYAAVLGPNHSDTQRRALFERVLGTDMVLFFEYDMAKYWLTH